MDIAVLDGLGPIGFVCFFFGDDGPRAGADGPGSGRAGLGRSGSKYPVGPGGRRERESRGVGIWGGFCGGMEACGGAIARGSRLDWDTAGDSSQDPGSGDESVGVDLGAWSEELGVV